MKRWFAHQYSAAPTPLDDELPGLAGPLALASRSCCCPARPAVMVIMPPSPGRHRVDLLLCGHHYRASQDALHAAGAAVYDETGALIITRSDELPPARFDGPRRQVPPQEAPQPGSCQPPDTRSRRS